MRHDPHEHRERDRRHQRLLAVVDALDLLVHELDAELDERLRLRRHARRGLARDEPHEADADDAQHERHHDGVDIDAKLVLPTCLTMKVRWCAMYSVGDSYEAAMDSCRSRISAVEQGQAEQQHRDHERGEERTGTIAL